MDVAIVTGAGRGLGRAIADRLAARRLAVCLADVELERAERSAAEIGAGAWATPLDVRDAAACRRVATDGARRGRIAVWVNNAGVLRPGRAWDQKDGEIDLMVGANLLGVLHGSRAAIEAMRTTGGGRILNVASLSALGAAPGLAIYGATKHGVLAFSTSLQLELRDAGLGIEVRSICPDALMTDMVTEHARNPEVALQWSGPMLEVGEVADRAVAALYGDRFTTVVPRWRGALARVTYASPRASGRLLPLFKWIGDRNRRRWLREAG